ncbi:MAG: hypothetical protein IH901_06795, partial [Proteobacteria bacterium]|nr:hypothetical protein [Pseudomonadota bacterium]
KIESRILIALKACDTALQSRYFSRMIAGDGPWAGRVFRPWMPKTYGELFDYYKEVWTFLEKQIDVLPLNLKNNIVKILTNNARGLITIKYLSKMVAETIDKLSQKPEIDKGPIVDAIYSIIKFEKEKLESNIISILEEADKKITGTDFHTKLQRYVGMYNMLRDLGNKSSPEIQELAKEGIKNKNLIKKELPILVRSGLKKSYHFGYEVGKIDKNFVYHRDVYKIRTTTGKKKKESNRNEIFHIHPDYQLIKGMRQPGPSKVTFSYPGPKP